MIDLPASATSLIAAAGLAAAITSIPFGDRAEAQKACPQFLTQYCVVAKGGYRHTEMTNPCFAKQQGLTVAHAGACRDH